MRQILSAILGMGLAMPLHASSVKIVKGWLDVLEPKAETSIPGLFLDGAHANEDINIPEFKQLSAAMLKDWSQILDEVPSVAATPKRQMILAVSAEGMPPQAYLDYLRKSVALYRSGRLAADVLRYAFFPAGDMETFVVDNNQDVQVRALLSDAVAATAADPQFRAMLQAALTHGPRVAPRGMEEFEGWREVSLVKNRVLHRQPPWLLTLVGVAFVERPVIGVFVVVGLCLLAGGVAWIWWLRAKRRQA